MTIPILEYWKKHNKEFNEWLEDELKTVEEKD